jgi:hypothetical protein
VLLKGKLLPALDGRVETSVLSGMSYCKELWKSCSRAARSLALTTAM